jgi:hypothetical protein
VLKYLRVPITPSSEEDDFEKAYEVSDDFDEVLEKISYEYVSILTDDPSMYYDSELLEYGDDWIVDDYSLSDFRRKVSRASSVPTYTYLEQKRVMESVGDKILPHDTDEVFQGKYLFDHTDCLYIKNVLISGAYVKITFLA